jgi:hypothetical protein
MYDALLPRCVAARCSYLCLFPRVVVAADAVAASLCVCVSVCLCVCVSCLCLCLCPWCSPSPPTRR